MSASERLPFRFPEPGDDPLAGLCRHCLEAPSGTFQRMKPEAIDVDPVATLVKLKAPETCSECQHPAHPRYRCFVAGPNDPPHTFCYCATHGVDA